MSTLPLPPHYDPAHAAAHAYAPDQQALFEAALAFRARHGVRPAASDARRVHLLLIDVQKDFCFPEGSLYVGGRSGGGAVADSQRICELVYRNLDLLSRITTTHDTHLSHQIFSPAFWQTGDGGPIRPHTEITAADVRAGRVRPDPALAGALAGGDEAWLRAQVLHYCESLERRGKYRLYVWPPHCMLGSDGHALVGAVHEARLFHSYVRAAQSHCESKGSHPLTENYSVFGPEVLDRHDGGVLAARNLELLDVVLAADVVVVAGQAASHCVRSSLDDLADEIVRRDRALARKIYVVEDCMSSVAVPDGAGGFAVDFTPQTEASLARWAALGMHVVRSSVELRAWPDMPAL